MSKIPEIANAPIIQLSCQILPQETEMPTGFAGDFCDALTSGLASAATVSFRLVPKGAWLMDGRAVQVDVRLNSENGAGVTIALGRVGDGAFIEQSSTEMGLYSSGQPLSPASAETLARGIFKQLGVE